VSGCVLSGCVLTGPSHKYNISLANEKKLNWLNRKKEKKTVSNINNIEYKVFHDSNKNEIVYKFNDIVSNGEVININISPEKFKKNVFTLLS